jgi:ATP-dependent helicase Lhr and Lhr-like helicase
VIQIDAPFSVAAFLQRLGRSGRRAGTRRNCLFLATDDDTFLRAVAIVHLWNTGYVEPVIPPPLPYHVLGQQILAQALQEGGIERHQIEACLADWVQTAGLDAEEMTTIVRHMLSASILMLDGGLLSVGREGEVEFGARHFIELFSIFNTPPLYAVFEGGVEIGQVSDLSFQRKPGEPIVLSLGGRAWKVTHIDRGRKVAYVERVDEAGHSRWHGSGRALHFALAQGIKTVLVQGLESAFLSKRAQSRMKEIRRNFEWLRMNETTIVISSATNSSEWWTFAGDRYNALAAQLLEAGSFATVRHSSFAVNAQNNDTQIPERIANLIQEIAVRPLPFVDPVAIDAVKFASCVPVDLLNAMLQARLAPTVDARVIAESTLVVRTE